MKPTMWAAYRPSNGTEGMEFMAEWCDQCVHAPDYEALKDCDILGRTFYLDTDDPNYPKEWLGRFNGRYFEAKCTAFERRVK